MKFTEYTPNEFAAAVESYAWTTSITGVHVHHTYRPDHETWRALGPQKTQLGMWRYHTGALGWSDIAQHATIMPDGLVVAGRSWARPPASSKGFNGNARAHPFMFEMVGDFETIADAEHDILEGDQLAAAVHVAGCILRRHNLTSKHVHFHRELHEKWKSCPGDTVDKGAFIAAVDSWLILNGARHLVFEE